MHKFLTIHTGLLCFAGVTSTAQITGNVAVNQLVIVANHTGPVINRDIYDHFSEHLGTCIYGGIWVGRDSMIPCIPCIWSIHRERGIQEVRPMQTNSENNR